MNALGKTAALGILLIGGCAGPREPEPLEPSAFQGTRQRVIAASPTSAADTPGAAILEYARVNVNVLGRGEPKPPDVEMPDDMRNARTVPPPDPSKAIEQAAGGALVPPPATQPTTRRTTNGSYYTVGAVVAEVNGRPIYADEVLEIIEPVLKARARELDEKQFRLAASKEIQAQVQELIQAELVFAAAQQSLTTDDQILAQRLAEQWRLQQITAASGSEEQARARARAENTTFEQMVDEKYRELMTQIYHEKRVRPRIQITAEDMRRYYFANLDKDFSEHGEVKFKLVRVVVREAGGREQAIAKLQEIRAKALDPGADLDTIAQQQKVSISNMGPIQRGAFVLEDVEKAVWATDVGGVTEVIDGGDAFYLARVEEKKAGKVQPFEAAEVQDRIYRTLHAEQTNKLREQLFADLIQKAILRGTPEMMAVALEMAMQKYPEWRENG